jgi:hypothetical protein
VREAASRIPDPAAPGDPSGGWSTVQVVAQAAGMDSAAWRRTGTHEVFGELDVAGLLREAHKHDLEHLADLERRRGTAPDA